MTLNNKQADMAGLKIKWTRYGVVPPAIQLEFLVINFLAEGNKNEVPK